MKTTLLFTLLCLLYHAGAWAMVVIHPVPKQIYYAQHNDDYTVKVRQKGELDWKDLYEYKVMVDMDRAVESSMVQFDFDGTVEVMVKLNNGTLRDAAVRPLSKGIRPRVEGNIILFTLDKPQLLSVECNGDRLHNLHVFANPLETQVPREGDAGVIYFGSGFHEPENQQTRSYRIPSNTTVYLAPGAVVKGKLQCDSVENVRICGRGILLTPQQGISINFSKNVSVDGITVINPRHYSIAGGQSDGITIRNFKSFSYQGWSDGIDMMCCRNVLVDNVFMRNSDDCIALYNHRWDFYGGSSDITIQNSTLWADVAHPINMGGHGNGKGEPGEVMERIVFRNIDILENDEDDPPYQGAIAVDVGDRNLVRDVLFEDIRIESIQEGCLFYIKVRYNDKYDTSPGRGLEQVVFRNIDCTAPMVAHSRLEGYDAQRGIRNVSFENVRVNGKKMKNLDDFITNEFVEDIRIK